MQTSFVPLAMLILLMGGTQAAASGWEVCQAGYAVMLMTEAECKAYVAERIALQTSGDLAALRMLDARMHDELVERAAACPCAADPTLKLALSQNDGC